MEQRFRRRRRKAGGFTLLEVLVATAILVVGLVGVAAAVTSLANLRRTYTETQAAITAARSSLEQVRAAAFATLLPTYGGGLGFDVDANGDGVPDLAPAPGQAQAGTVRVEVVANVPPAALGRLLRATATVRWRGVSGNREVRLVTLVSDRGGA